MGTLSTKEQLKQELIEELLKASRLEMVHLEEAMQSSMSMATDQEFKAESKYDTRALEASYLASAEARRLEEIKQEIQLLEEVDLKASARMREVAIGALVELLFQQQKRFYFLIPTAGGTLLQLQGQTVLVVSVFSPIGSAMLGLKEGESFEVETPKETRTYEVVTFY